jgi:hypothetical protein
VEPAGDFPCLRDELPRPGWIVPDSDLLFLASAVAGPSASVEILIGRFAVVLAVGFLFWVMIALWADPFY